MSFDVELLVAFHCSWYDGVAALARRHLPSIRSSAGSQCIPEAIALLDDLAGRAGSTDQGPKNGLAVWTYGGNYTRPDAFGEVLRPFWDDLLRYPVDGGPLRFNHILILYQLQDAWRCEALEILLDLPEDAFAQERDWSVFPLLIRRHEDLPFRW